MWFINSESRGKRIRNIADALVASDVMTALIA